MSDESNTSPPSQTADAVPQSPQSNTSSGTPGQALTVDQRNERREALLKRQREAREKAQQISQAARANASLTTTTTTTTTTNNTSPAQPAANTNMASTPATVPASAPVAAAAAAVPDAPVRENMVQQAVSFLSSPSVQSAEESKKIQFLEKKGLTTKEIELAKARVAGTASTPAPQQPQQQQQPSYQTPAPAPMNSATAPPPVPPRTYAPAQAYAQPMYIPQPQQQQVAVDPLAFKKKLVIAMLISGGVTILTSVIVQKLIYPMVRGITGARQTLAVSQTELLSKLKEKLVGYKEYLLGLHLGSNRGPVKTIKDTKTTVEDEEEQGVGSKKSTTITTTKTTSTTTSASSNQSTVKQLDAFSKKLESHANNLNFEQLKATRAVTQDLAEYITKETYALSTSIAYPTSRYYGYNTVGAAASGKGGLADPTTPESALRSEIRSLKGLLLNWRNFPVAKEGAAPVGPGGMSGVGGGSMPNLVQQQ
ncbi:hypothetical protein BGZ51_001272 [Haplosporangium sp. Z 767]|nr:hypothetical protein BGZ51_001272 [Haplosporangium sp. Z 767]KAF9194819.1 hypothetical protein BGZ50_005699 [Haplosporangium sp. Z 11]